MTDTITVPAEAEKLVLKVGGHRLVLQMNGDVLELTADCDVAIGSASVLRLGGAEGVRISSGESVVELTPGEVSITSDKTITRARLAQCEGRELRLSADLMRVSCGKFERIAVRVLEYARESYQRIDNLLHVKAGRIRSESQSNHLLHGATVRIDAKEDVRIMGEKIHLR